jgi:2-polyprenyl-3-methyl-5-hydroxy-6-metoxy-1,4-benzoquinol methylase
VADLRCVECGGELTSEEGALECRGCGERYPLRGGTVRMLPRALRSSGDPEAAIKRRTGASFAYEWKRFGRPRPEWRRNFIGYMQPHDTQFFAGKRVLDVGTGSGRHAREAAELGADVVAVDVGESIDVARGNLPDGVLTVQADAESLPFPPASFDFVMSIGVLHHLPDTGRAIERLKEHVRPGGHLHLYLYWQPSRASHRAVLRLVSTARSVTTRMPRGLLHVLCYPLALLLLVFVVVPYRILRRVPRLRRIAEWFPLKAYADYPFGVLVNDQFDRLSAPIERRFTRDQVETMMRDAELTDVVVLPHHGWIADGRRAPESGSVQS